MEILDRLARRLDPQVMAGFALVVFGLWIALSLWWLGYYG